MGANLFVKTFGIYKARQVVKIASCCYNTIGHNKYELKGDITLEAYISKPDCVDIRHLKTLVDAQDTVNNAIYVWKR